MEGAAPRKTSSGRLDVPAPEGRSLGERYRFERFSDSGIEAGRVTRLWTAEGALSEQQAAERVRDVVLVALDRDDSVVGVSTAWLHENSHLRMTLWNYRTYVSREHREGDIAFLLLHATRDELRERFTSGADTRAGGILMEVQNELLKRHRAQGVWATSRFAFIGDDERGAHHRVYFFPGATAPVRP